MSHQIRGNAGAHSATEATLDTRQPNAPTAPLADANEAPPEWVADAGDAPEAAPPPEPGGWLAWLSGFALGLGALGAAVLLLGGVLLLALGAPPTSVLLVGLDTRPDEQARGIPGHTDSVLVLVLAPPGRATLVSFPRDLWLDIPGYGPQRLNVAYPLGAQAGGPRAGSALLARTLAGTFGLRVERWAVVHFDGFAAVVDALGGVDVTVPRPLVDEAYPTEDYGTRRLEIPAGRQHFDGATALAYVRTRAPDSDFGRMARQQQVLVALRDRALSPGGLLRLPAALLTLRQAVISDLSPRETLALLRTLALLSHDRLTTLVIGPDLAPPQLGPGGAAILMPRTEAIRATLAEALAAGGPAR